MVDDDELERSSRVIDALASLAQEHGANDPTATGKILSMMTSLTVAPDSSFPKPPSYRRHLDETATVGPEPTVESSHGFFDVVRARASRRDYGDKPLPSDIVTSILAWTLGRRDETIAYDWRGAPRRYCASAGGLASVDGYCLTFNVDGLDEGSYYYDYERGLIATFAGAVSQKVAGALPGMAWLEKAAAVIVLVGNPDRVDHKYGALAPKLCLIDAGVAAGHLELVATALETRACLLGALPVDLLSDLLALEHGQIPLVSIAIGSRES